MQKKEEKSTTGYKSKIIEDNNIEHVESLQTVPTTPSFNPFHQFITKCINNTRNCSVYYIYSFIFQQNQLK